MTTPRPGPARRPDPTRSHPDAPNSSAREPEARLLDPRGRAKVFRPLATAEREAAIERGLDAYTRGDWYLAHEELEPAWMGTADPGERELLGGLIKLSAAFVHAARGNPAGVRTNLDGARVRLAGAEAAGVDRGLDLPGMLAAVDRCLDAVERLPAARAGDGDGAGGGPFADPPHDVAGPGGRVRGAPLDLVPPALTWRSTGR